MIKATAVLITKLKEYPKEIDLSGFDEVLIRTESPSVYERYLLASKARNEIIYVQDDDCIVDYNELFKSYNGQLTNTMTPHHYEMYKGAGDTLVGWGCFFPKKMLQQIAKYSGVYGIDFHLLREADRIFTFLNQPHNTIIMPHTDFNQVGRMWHDVQHFAYREEALAKVRSL